MSSAFSHHGGLIIALVALALAVATWLAAVCLSTLWIYLLGGAETLAEHPGLFTSGPTKPLGFKIVWGLLVASILVGYALSTTRP